MKAPEWKIPEVFTGDTRALEEAGISKLLAALMSVRGFDSPEKAGAFLSRDERALSNPFLLTDMDKAVRRIESAISKEEKAAVFGDYDVDGITASCLLCDYLIGRGLDCRIYIPDRIDEGYGLNPGALEILKEQGISLVITVDCGVTAADDVMFAKSIDLDIIITDHHECPTEFPDCCAVVNPKRHTEEHPAYYLAGVGVALKLACALDGGAEKVLERYCDLVAVGTIADVMPLIGENRVLTYAGLEKLKTNPRPGFAALLSEAGVADKPITTSVVGFSLAPRINAAGRLCETKTSVELLMCEDPKKSREYAERLCELNRRRQELELKVWQDSVEQLESVPPEGPIVLASDNWHPGVVGIAASRLSEAYRLPAVMICVDGEEGKGSCRSYGQFNLFEALTACREHLEGFGGHAYAAGINIKSDKIDDFRTGLTKYYAENMPDICEEISPELQLSNFTELSMENVESLDALEPCGQGNPKPLICVCGAMVESVTAIGGGKHLRMNLSCGSQSVEGVFFGHTPEDIDVSQGSVADICFTPQINEFRSRKSVQLLLSGIRRSENIDLCREILESAAAKPEGAGKIFLSREKLGELWRALRLAGGEFELSGLFKGARLGAFGAIETCLGIKVFQELGLLQYSLVNGTVNYKVISETGKANLEDSQLFRVLSKNAGAE